MNDEVKTCKDCKHYIADGSSRRGHCELKRSRIDKWGPVSYTHLTLPTT